MITSCFYNILGVREDDDIETVHKIRNLLLLRYHPDKKSYNKERYDSIYNAYEKIIENKREIVNNNPRILKRIKLIVFVDIEDFYFKKELYVAYSRRVFCKNCDGTKTFIKDLSKSKCSYCEGRGYIDNKIYQTFYEKNVCVFCNGTGIAKEYICNSCNGTGYIKEIKSLSFTLDLEDYENGFKKISGEGDQINKDKYGDVFISLKIKPNEEIKIEDGCFVVSKEVFPSQVIVGDNEEIVLFGNKKLSYRLNRGNLISYIEDKETGQVIKVKHTIKYPEITERTLALYEEILKIEKSMG